MTTASLFFSLFFFFFFCFVGGTQSTAVSAPLIHRFSDEAQAALGGGAYAPRHSREYYQMLLNGDLARRQRHRRRLAGHSTMFPAAGDDVFELGNDFGWLHYTWIDIGTPNVSFLVALDAGSDLLWVPCDCIQCAPLTSNSLGKALGVYNPALSRTSKHISCSHELCSSGTSCDDPKQPCTYTVNYYSENTSSSGLLVEDFLYLASRSNGKPIKVPVIVGCGRKQSGGYLDGIAPDGLLGLGFGEISVPSILAKAGLIQNTFSLCFGEDETGRIHFGDQGVPNQRSTPFIALDGKYITYIVEVERFCVGSHCLGKTTFQALVDSGSSFTYLPQDVYHRVAREFDDQVNASRMDYDASTWEYCYKASALQMPAVPDVVLVFAPNSSFVAINPIFPIYGKEDELTGFCLALQSSPDTLGTIGQNFMTGYRMVFDRENLKLGWSHSNCQDHENSKTLPLTPPPSPNKPENPLPTDEQQNSPGGTAVPPAVAVKTPTDTKSVAPPRTHPCSYLQLILFYMVVILAG